MSMYYASIADNIADKIAATILLLRRVNALYYEEAFSIRMGLSTGPHILLFKRFVAFWKNILISNFKRAHGIEIQSVAAAVLDFSADVSAFCISPN